MATVCSYYKFGYCKHKEYCRKRHLKGICDNFECDISKCVFRHPKVCKWFRKYRNCKFDPCLYLHIENDTEIEFLKKENSAVLKNIENIENALKVLDVKIVDSETIIDRLETIQNKFEKFTQMEKQMFEQETVINDLVKRVNDMEANLNNKNDIINDLAEKLTNKECCQENELSQNETTFFNPSDVLQHCEKCSFETYQEDDMERHVKATHTTNFKCDLCDFISKTTGGLKTHKTKMHTRLPPRFPQSFPPYPMSPYDV